MRWTSTRPTREPEARRVLWFRVGDAPYFTFPVPRRAVSPAVRSLPDWRDVPPVAPKRARRPPAVETPPESAPSPGPAGENQRRHPRRPVAQQVDYTIGDRFYRDSMRDISLGGMFIETPLLLEVGQEVTVSIPFSDGRPPVRLRGEVVRVAADGIGVRFRRDTKTLRG